MDSDQGKLFIGGISWETSEDKLKEYFGNYGDILQAVVMRDKLTGKPRGFGFVVFADPSLLDTVLQDKHIIDGRTVDAKRALSREEQVSKAGNPSGGRNFGGGGNIKTKKIFVGGLPPTLTEEGFRQYFEAYGHVTDVVVMYDQQTNRPRGFGFISFDSEDAVDRVLHKTFHDLDGKQVEVKRALPKDSNPGGGRGNGGGVSYQGYGGSGGNSSSYEGRMDSNRYMQSQNAGGGFPSFGYGYGATNNSVGYGSYGGYGGGAGGAYGNPSVPNAGYGSGPQGAPRSSWNNSMGYGSAQWGAPTAGNGGPVSMPTAQSPAGGYGNQGYGYGGSDGSYGNTAVYGAVGGRIGSVPNSNSSGGGGELQSGGGGYMGGSYADANQGWRTDPANYGAQANVGYGGGYGGGPARQVQQQ